MVDDLLVEKYRPNTLKDVCGQQHIMDDLNSFSYKKDFPHLIFYGQQGVGKTTSAIALGKDILGETFPVNFLELNASDERGIDVVRDKVKMFARQQPINVEFKIIMLDECDALTPAAQNALRRIMEKYSKTCRFILCCNTISNMIPPIISRCAPYNFLPLKTEDIRKRIEFIALGESFQYDLKGLDYLADSADGDIRRAIIRLQAVATKGAITLDNIYSDTVEGSFLFVVKSLFKDKNWNAARQGVKQYLMEGGSNRELILRLHNFIIKKEIVSITHLPNIVRVFRKAERDFILGLTPQLTIDAMLFDILDVLNT